MLERLRVENFALIEEVDIELSPGLNLLTGETGAGKSLVIDAVGLLIGGRAANDVVRSGKDKARIEGLFRIAGPGNEELRKNLSELGVDPDEDDLLLLTREITRTGKSVCRINGRSVPVSVFREAGGQLIDLQGQHEQQSLLNARKHCQLLDRLTGGEGERALESVKQAYEELKAIDVELERLQGNERERIQRLDLLTYQMTEITEAQLVTGEDEELEHERKRLQNMEKLMAQANTAYLALFGESRDGVLELLDKARLSLEDSAVYDGNLKELAQNLDMAYYQIEDVAQRLRDYRVDLEFQPERLEEIADRLDLIRRLKRKYGNSIEDIMQYHDRIGLEIKELENCDERIASLLSARDKLLSLYETEAKKLSQIRRKMAVELQGAIEKELAYLGMNRARLEVQFETRIEPSATGAEDIEFLFAPNPGEPVKPLAKIASGGELARILLAFKTLLARVEGIPSLIFDEIDSGIGGQALQAVAQKMAQVAQDVQIICVTHAPQLAAYADTHFLIRKAVKGQRTITSIIALDDTERVKELARMLGGDQASSLTHSHAREMFARARH